jgi:hypothetical protein
MEAGSEQCKEPDDEKLLRVCRLTNVMGQASGRQVCPIGRSRVQRTFATITRNVKLGRGHQGAAGLRHRGSWDGRYPNIHS